MAAPKGNRFWEARSKHGRNPIFADADQLWDACTDYFEWVEANPLYEDKVTSFQGVNTHEPIAKMRAMTIGGLCIFLDIARSTWDEYQAKQGFSAITTRVEGIIRDQKFTGAAADLLNPNIIARDLGLADKSELTGKDGAPIAVVDMTDIEKARRLAFALARANAQSE